MKNLLPFAYSVAFVSVLILLFIEWQVPGFVSYVFPFYWLVIVLITLGLVTHLASARGQGQEGPIRGSVPTVLAALVGLLLCFIVLKNGDTFLFMKIPLAIIAAVFPGVLVLLTRRG